jgi:hypothetical protein
VAGTQSNVTILSIGEDWDSADVIAQLDEGGPQAMEPVMQVRLADRKHSARAYSYITHSHADCGGERQRRVGRRLRSGVALVECGNRGSGSPRHRIRRTRYGNGEER